MDSTKAIFIGVVVGCLGSLSAFGQDQPPTSSTPREANIRHYMTANFEFYAEEPDWNGSQKATVRQRIYIMPHIYLSKYDGVTLYLAGDTTIDRLLDAVLWGTPLPTGHPLEATVPDQSLLNQIDTSDASSKGLASTGLSEYEIQELTDQNREKVIRAEASRIYSVIYEAEVAHAARVWFSTAPPLLTDIQRQEILSAIYNIDPLLSGSPSYVYDIIENGTSFPGFSKHKSHSFEYLSPRSFSADIRVASDAEPIDRMTYVGAVAGRSSFGFFLDELSLPELERVGRGHFSINVRGRVDLSRVQELVASFDYEAFSEQLYENFFSRRIVTESKSGRRWFKKYTRTSVETHVRAEQRKVSTSDMASSISIRTRDWTNPVLLDRMYDFIFPKSATTSVDDLIAKHLAEASKPGQDPETKKIHEAYAKHLRTIANRNYDELQDSENEFKNSIVDAQDDEKKKAIAKAIVSLLQTGFGGSLDRSNSYLEIRELRKSEYYESRSRTFSAMMFESTEAGVAVSKSRFLTAPIEVTHSHDLQGHIERLLRMRVDSINPVIYPAPPALPDIPPQPLKAIEPTWPNDPWGPYRELIRDGVDMTPSDGRND